jgi:alanyl-tRNA synthetase
MGAETARLYYQDAYLRSFSAEVVASKVLQEGVAVALDRSAFYPTGGGQPHDTGTLGQARVIDVSLEGGVVWHALEAGSTVPPVGSGITGAIDWPRRFDHMQQHSGQHILSAAFVKGCCAQTVAFHMGEDYCTIDIDRTTLTAEDLEAVEAAANAVVDQALPVTATFVSDDELKRLPLRKPPAVAGAVRIVEVMGYDWSPCGGTHVANTAQCGLIEITSTERRGPETRVTFLCGQRARADYRRLRLLAAGLGARFSSGPGEWLDALDRLTAEAKATRKELAALEIEWADAQATALWAAAVPAGPWKVVCQAVDHPAERAKRIAQALKARSGTVVLLGARGERPQLFFGRADDVGLDAGALLRAAAMAAGGRGGGRPEWAQGGAPDNTALGQALAAALAAVAARAGE